MRIRKTSQYMEDGASLSNVYGTSDSNGYTQEYINSLHQKTTLYENDTWTGNNESITLSDSAANYDYLEIFYGIFNIGGDTYKSVKIANPNGKTAILDGIVRDGNQNAVFFIGSNWSISTTTMSLSSIAKSYMYNSSTNNINTTDKNVYIKKVVGIKEA